MKRGLLSFFLCACCLLSILGQEGYPAIDNDYVPTHHTIRKDYAVGQIDLSSGISSTGAKTYTVPIATYPGIRNLNPGLALTYNSQQGNGLIGVGWSLAGLSNIYRTSHTIHYDGDVEQIGMNRSDAFMLDGLRLLRVDSVTFLTEQGYIRAKTHYTGDVLQYFDVCYPDGKTAVFGYKDNTENQLYYPLTELSDLWGNTITYQYNFNYEHNHYQVQKINYNGASVEFGYERRPDPVAFYLGGKEIIENTRLQTITCKFGTKELGKYTLSYQNAEHLAGKPSLLQNITYEAGGKKINPLIFYYGKNKSQLTYTTEEINCPDIWHGGEEAHSAQFVVGRMMGNGYSDILASVSGKTPYIQDNTKDFECFYNPFNLSDYIYTYTLLGSGNGEAKKSFPCGTGFVDLLAADISGRGRDFLIQVNNEVVDKQYDQVRFTVHNGPVFSIYDEPSPSFTRTFKFPTVHTSAKGMRSIQPKFYYPGDFNGDGKIEILAVSAHQPFGNTNLPSTCYLFDLKGNKILYQGHLFPYHVSFPSEDTDEEELYNSTDELIVADYDGDGKSEIHYKSTDGKAQTFVFDVSGNTWLPRQTHNYQTTPVADSEWFIMGDFNSDGLADRFYYKRKQEKGSTPKVYIAFSKGNSQDSIHNVTLPYLKEVSTGKEDHYLYIPTDINGDGVTDIIECADEKFHIFIFDKYTKQFYLYKSIKPGQDKRHTALSANVQTKDGYSTEFVSIDGEKLIKYSFQRNDSEECLLTGVVNSFGVVEKNEYALMNESGKKEGIYSYYIPAPYPYTSAYGKQPLIAVSETYVDGKQVDGQHYYYEGGIQHLTGMGFCGFTQTRTIDFKGKERVCEYDPENHGVLEYEYNEGISESYYYYEVIEHPNRMVEINLTDKEYFDNVRDMSTDYRYEDYRFGYPNIEEIEYEDNSVRRTETIYTSVQTGYKTKTRKGENADVCTMLAYIPPGKEYILGRIHEQTVRTTTEDGKNVTKRTTYPSWLYDMPQAKREYLGQETRYDCQYDKQGNLIKSTTGWSGGAESISESWEYDTYGRKTKHTSETGTTEQYAYDMQGRLSTHTDSRGNITTYSYDEFGKEKTVNRPDGTNVTTEYEWIPDRNEGLYAVTVKETGQPDRKTVYDALGREVRTAEMTYDGKWRYVDTEYDNYGRVTRKSSPYTQTTPSYYSTYTYDNLDRMLSATDRPGHTTTYSYTGSLEGYTVTTTENGVETSRSYGPHGELVQVDDPGGTTLYTWEPDLQPSTITAPDGSQITFEYNASRRCSAKNDPGFGRTTYGYENSGEKAWEQNAKGERTRYFYDDYNRLTNCAGTSPNVAYTYTPYGEIATIKGFNGTFISYTYDNLGRLASYREDAPDGKWLRKDYTYKDGQISSITYTSQNGELTTENLRYQNGHLVEVTLPDGTSIFRLDGESRMGLPTLVQTGQLTRQYGYDAYGYPTSRKANMGKVTHQNFSYTFDTSRNNLLSRTDELRNRTETFNYDGMNRLASDGRTTVEYSPSGNIIRKSDVGDYTYGLQANPHAHTGVENPAKYPTPTGLQEITYNSSNLPDSIYDWMSAAKFTYNGNFDRVKSVYYQNGTIHYMTRYYLGGCYELDSLKYDRIEKLYLHGGYYDAPIVWRKRNNTKPELYHVLRDPLGSITNVVRDDGYRQEELSYDAWGHLRNPMGWEPLSQAKMSLTGGSTPSSTFLGRGFCGHEQLPVANLVHMNARLYDPWTGRFLSPDPYVQFPDFSQGLNRYSYCMNNPLIYVDENGEFFWIIVGVAALIGGTANVAMHWDEIKAAGGGWKGFKKGLGYFAIGGLAGGVGAAAGVAAATGFRGMLGITSAQWAAGMTGFVNGAQVGLASGMASGFIQNTGNSLLEGADFGGALESGIMGAIMGGASGGLMGGISGGISARIQGKDFWTGAEKAISNRDLIQQAADMAYKEIPGEGPVVGTKRHEFATKYLEEYQDIHGDRGLEFKVYFTYRLTNERGIVDVLDKQNQMIYDFKFGYPNKTPEMLNNTLQMQKYRNHFKWPSEIIKPQIKY